MNPFFLLPVIFVSVIYFLFLILVYAGIINLRSAKIKAANKHKLKLTVVIPFRNEAENLPDLLRDLSKQTYPKDLFEVILVDDNSTDNSVELIKKNITLENYLILKNDSNLKRAFKKNAMLKGIENSHGEIIISTDADCRLPATWLESLVKYFDENTALVSGPVKFDSDNTMFGKMQSLEFAGLVLVGAGLIGIKKPIIANAANLAFRKSVFFEVGGYEDNLHLTSGDDEILMQKIAAATNYKIKYAWDKNALVSSKGNSDLSEFFRQRRRWASKSLFYFNKGITLFLFLVFLFYLLIITLPALFLLGVKETGEIFLFLFSTKILIEYFLVMQGENFFFEKGLRRYFFLTEIFQIPYIVLAAVLGVFGNYEWKKRKIKR